MSDARIPVLLTVKQWNVVVAGLDFAVVSDQLLSKADGPLAERREVRKMKTFDIMSDIQAQVTLAAAKQS